MTAETPFSSNWSAGSATDHQSTHDEDGIDGRHAPPRQRPSIWSQPGSTEPTTPEPTTPEPTTPEPTAPAVPIVPEPPEIAPLADSPPAAPRERLAESGPPPEVEPFVVDSRPRPQRSAYERGVDEDWQLIVIERTVDLALATCPIPLRILDVGCGTGALLDEVVLRVPYAEAYVGVDPLRSVVAAARRQSDVRISYVRGEAEALPFSAGSFDLVFATMSVGYWQDPRSGVAELARVITDAGVVIVVDPVSGRGSARRLPDLLAAARLRLERTEVVHRTRLRKPVARAFIASP